jgi:hypothetical protein
LKRPPVYPLAAAAPSCEVVGEGGGDDEDTNTEDNLPYALFRYHPTSNNESNKKPAARNNLDEAEPTNKTSTHESQLMHEG